MEILDNYIKLKDKIMQAKNPLSPPVILSDFYRQLEKIKRFDNRAKLKDKIMQARNPMNIETRVSIIEQLARRGILHLLLSANKLRAITIFISL